MCLEGVIWSSFPCVSQDTMCPRMLGPGPGAIRSRGSQAARVPLTGEDGLIISGLPKRDIRGIFLSYLFSSLSSCACVPSDSLVLCLMAKEVGFRCALVRIPANGK